MPYYVIEVTATYENITVSADSVEEAIEIAKMGIVDRWPDAVEARPQIRFCKYKHMDNYPVTTEEGYLGC